MKFITLMFLIFTVSNAYSSDQCGGNRDKECKSIDAYEGMMRFEERCSGSLVKFENQPLDQNAYMLTNGHCLNGHTLENGEMLVDVDYLGNKDVVLIDFMRKQHTLKLKKLVYATITGTDLALLRLEKTYNEIEKEYKVKPLTVISEKPKAGIKIQVISGFWVETYSCSIDKFVSTLKMGREYPNINDLFKITTDVMKYTKGGDCDKTPGGSSGSPIIKKGARLMVGIHGSANLFNNVADCKHFDGCEVNDNGEIIIERPKCAKHYGCEITEDNKTTVVDPGARYGFQVYQLNGCLTKDFEFNINLNTCELIGPSIGSL